MDEADPKVTSSCHELIGRIADKCTMISSKCCLKHEMLRFCSLAELSAASAKKLLTQTLRQHGADGLVTRTVSRSSPHKFEYADSDLGETSAGAFCEECGNGLVRRISTR